MKDDWPRAIISRRQIWNFLSLSLSFFICVYSVFVSFPIWPKRSNVLSNDLWTVFGQLGCLKCIYTECMNAHLNRNQKDRGVRWKRWVVPITVRVESIWRHRDWVMILNWSSNRFFTDAKQISNRNTGSFHIYDRGCSYMYMLRIAPMPHPSSIYAPRNLYRSVRLLLYWKSSKYICIYIYIGIDEIVCLSQPYSYNWINMLHFLRLICKICCAIRAETYCVY